MAEAIQSTEFKAEEEQNVPENAADDQAIPQKKLELNLDVTNKGVSKGTVSKKERDDSRKKSERELREMYQQTSSLTGPFGQQRQAKPMNFLRMSTISVSSRRAENLERSRKSSFTDEPTFRRTRTPPGPDKYTPRIEPIKRNAPSFPIAHKDKSYAGGGRTSWETSFFLNAHDVWSKRTRFDDADWPAPGQYTEEDILYIGKPLISRKNPPLFTIATGSSREKSFLVARDAENIPASIKYDRGASDGLILPKAPAFKIATRERTMPWREPEITPGPSEYTPRLVSRNRQAGFTIPVKRRERRMDQVLGPIFVR